jgi:hypothetical protein
MFSVCFGSLLNCVHQHPLPSPLCIGEAGYTYAFREFFMSSLRGHFEGRKRGKTNNFSFSHYWWVPAILRFPCVTFSIFFCFDGSKLKNRIAEGKYLDQKDYLFRKPYCSSKHRAVDKSGLDCVWKVEINGVVPFLRNIRTRSNYFFDVLYTRNPPFLIDKLWR